LANPVFNDIPAGPNAVVTSGTVQKNVPGNRYTKRQRMTGTGSYPTGGYAVTPAQLGFSEQIDYLDIVNELPGATASWWTWNTVTQKLQLIVVATGNELANAQNDGGATVDFIAYGF
jgi:hypothetical protein